MHKTKQATMNQEVEEATFTKVNKAETDGNGIFLFYYYFCLNIFYYY